MSPSNVTPLFRDAPSGATKDVVPHPAQGAEAAPRLDLDAREGHTDHHARIASAGKSIRGYPLSPTQAGMLYQALLGDAAAGKSGGYDIEQMKMTLAEPIDPGAFGRAFTKVTRHHAVLSTSFHWENMDEPEQRVQKNVRVPMHVEDWRALDEAARARRMDEFLVRDRARGFDLRRAPLMRLNVFRIHSSRTEVVWTFHHILVDGRALEPILRQVFEQYDATRRRKQVPLPPVPRSYREYAEWVARLDHQKSLAYFRELLRGKTTPTLLPGAEPASRPLEGRGYGEIIREMDAASTAAAVECARRTGTTLNTLVQAAWSLVLARYGGDEDARADVRRSVAMPRRWSVCSSTRSRSAPGPAASGPCAIYSPICAPRASPSVPTSTRRSPSSTARATLGGGLRFSKR
jgi:hypothetical protein